MTGTSPFFVQYPVADSLNLSNTGWGISPLDIAHALAINPAGSANANAVVILRPTPQPVVAIVGYFEKSARTKFEALRWQLDWSLSKLRYVDYKQAEVDCTILAEALVDRFGREELRGFHFTAIPRGGLIVLGMLSYILHLERDQVINFADRLPDDAPIVVVDDCAFTGLRFGEFLQQFPERPVSFAHLYSHPKLRRAILDRESQVIACVSAQDLHDYAPEQFAPEYESWRRRHLQRSGDRCYWVGLTDHICFAWNEPDFSLWNPVTEREEPGWRVLPPELCLKNRPAPGAQPLPVQIQQEGTGPLKPSEDILYGILKEEVIIGNMETGISYSLEASAADMWQGLVRHGNIDDMVAELGQTYDTDETNLRADAEAFVSQLMAAGLLENSSEDENADEK